MAVHCLHYNPEKKALILNDFNIKEEALQHEIAAIPDEIAQKVETCILSNAVFLERIPQGLGRFPHLKTLEIERCNTLKNLYHIENLSLEEIKASSCIQLEDISQIQALKNLQGLDVSHCLSIRSLESLSSIKETLQRLNLEGLANLQTTRRLVGLKNLTQLNIRNTSIKDTTGLEFIPSLLFP